MKTSERWITQRGGDSMVIGLCKECHRTYGHDEDCRVGELVRLEAENAALKNNLKVIQTTNDELRNTVKSLRELAYDYIQAYEKLAFGDALLTGEKKEWVHPMTLGECVEAERKDE